MAESASLDSLPVKDGFRQRGMDMTRLETFTDAAFAFAVTLLVVGGGDSVPGSFDEMITAMKQVPAFAACFANIMLFWYAHHIWSRRFGLDDWQTAILSLFLIFVVLIYVYPLKAIYSGAIEFFSGGFFPSFFVLRSPDDLRDMFMIFSTGYVALSGVMVLLNRYALYRRESLQLNEAEVFLTRSEQRSWGIHVGIAALSIVLALTMPDPLIVLAGMCYGLLGIIVPWHAHRQEKGLQAIEASSA